MKKIVLCAVALMFAYLYMPINKAKAFEFDGVYTFCTTDKIQQKNSVVQKNGDYYFVSCDSNSATEIKNSLSTILCESVVFDGDEKTFYQICKTLGRQYFCYQIDGVVVVEGFSQNLAKPFEKQGRYINFQAVFDGNKITVGTPLIMGSF